MVKLLQNKQDKQHIHGLSTDRLICPLKMIVRVKTTKQNFVKCEIPACHCNKGSKSKEPDSDREDVDVDCDVELICFGACSRLCREQGYLMYQVGWLTNNLAASLFQL